MIVGLDHVQVGAPPGCEDAARAFFGGLLGLAEIEKPPSLVPRGGVWFQAGDQELHVGVTSGFVGAAKAHPACLVDSPKELGRLATRLEAYGAAVTRPDPGEIPGTARIYVADPWGNRIELVTPDPRGAFT